MRFEKGNKLAKGNKGNTSSARELVNRLRTLTIKESIAIIENGDDPEFKKALILRLAGSILPRLNEHTGEDGGDMQISIKVESGSYQEKVLKEKGIIK